MLAQNSHQGGLGVVPAFEDHVIEAASSAGLPTMCARVAIYDAPASAPLVEDVCGSDAREFIEMLAARVSDIVLSRGGSIPYSVLREVAENLIHAGFAEPVVSILDHGQTVRFSDQGPGIPDKTRARQPGFTTATHSMKQVIRGVGSGLPIVGDFLNVMGGTLSIEDNLDSGSVVTLSAAPRRIDASPAASASADQVLIGPATADAHSPAYMPLVLESVEEASAVWLSTRQKQVLALVLESGSAGPSMVSKELGVGLSTAYRDLASLEDMGLIASEGGKRAITPAGVSYLGSCSSFDR